MVLELANDESILGALDKAIDNSNLDSVERAVGGDFRAWSNGVSHMLFMYRVEDGSNLMKASLQFASRYIAELVVNMILTKSKDDLYKLLSSAEKKPVFGSFYGLLYEPLVHQILSEGGKFNCRALEPATGQSLGTSSDFKLDIGHTNFQGGLIWRNELELKNLPCDTYACPHSKNEAAIDAVMRITNSSLDSSCNPQPRLRLFQMTKAENHPVLKDSIVSVLKNLHPAGAAHIPVELYFVVPGLKYAKFTRQNYLNKDGKVSVDQTLTGVQQFVVEVNLTQDSPTAPPTLPLPLPLIAPVTGTLTTTSLLPSVSVAPTTGPTQASAQTLLPQGVPGPSFQFPLPPALPRSTQVAPIPASISHSAGSVKHSQSSTVVQQEEPKKQRRAPK